jgi:N-glycosylase/DNA lyase
MIFPPSEIEMPRVIARSPDIAHAALHLENTLSSGQVFRWTRSRDGWWSAPIGSSGLVIAVLQDGSLVSVQTAGSEGQAETAHDYFQTQVDIGSLLDEWTNTSSDCEIAAAAISLAGLRVCRQDPVECLFSFLCSSAAPVFRIRRMIENVCNALGEPICGVFGEKLYAFPKLERLASTSRTTFDELGLGYRGGFVQKAAAELVARGGRAYVERLADAPYADAKAALVSLPGVGAKIADCTCLFALGKHEAAPIDTHMARIAIRVVAPDLAGKSLTPVVYDELSGRFRERFGAFAGWAQQYLFTAELHKTGAWDSEMGRHRPGRRVTSAK